MAAMLLAFQRRLKYYCELTAQLMPMILMMRMILKIVLCSGALIVSGGTVQASTGQRTDVRSVLKLEEALSEAKANSPEVKAARWQVEASANRARQYLAPAEPTLSIQYNDMQSAFSLGHPASIVYQLQQPIGFPGKAVIGRSAIKNQERALTEQLRAIELTVAANVRAAYIQLALAQKNLQLNAEQTEAYKRILQITRRRYETGAIPQVDLLNAEVAFYGNANDVADLQSAERSASGQLNILMARDLADDFMTEPLKSTPFAIPQLSRAEEKMLSDRHELRAARYQFEAANDTYRLTKISFLPDFQLIAGTTDYKIGGASPINSVAPEVSRTYLIGVQLTIPLWSFFNERQGLSAASADRAASEATLQSSINQSRASLKAVIENLGSLSFKISNYEQHLLPLTEQALTLALINYSAGKIDFQTLVDAASAKRNVRRDYLTSLTNYQTSYTQLGQLIGEEQ